MIVIKTYKELQLNKIYGNSPWESTTDNEGNECRFSFRVVKEATIEDYFKYVEENTRYKREDLTPDMLNNKKFYFVLSD